MDEEKPDNVVGLKPRSIRCNPPFERVPTCAHDPGTGKRFHCEICVGELLSSAEIYDEPKPPREAVWSVCSYLRMNLPETECKRCEEIVDEPNFGPCIHGCYGIAEEACRVVTGAIKKYPPAT